MDCSVELMDGTVLAATPRTNGAQPEWPASEIRRAEEELFVRNAHFLFANKDRIFVEGARCATCAAFVAD